MYLVGFKSPGFDNCCELRGNYQKLLDLQTTLYYFGMHGYCVNAMSKVLKTAKKISKLHIPMLCYSIVSLPNILFAKTNAITL